MGAPGGDPKDKGQLCWCCVAAGVLLRYYVVIVVVWTARSLVSKSRLAASLVD